MVSLQTWILLLIKRCSSQLVVYRWTFHWCVDSVCIFNTNLLLTEREGRAGEYWPEVVAVRIERSEVRTKTTEGQYSKVRLELAWLVSSLLYDTRTMLVLNLPPFENKKTTKPMTVSTETVHMAKSRPRKRQSERSDLPEDYLAI